MHVPLPAVPGEQGRHGRVAHHGAGNVLREELERRQARSLLVRPGLGEEGVVEAVEAVERADDAQSSAVALQEIQGQSAPRYG